MSKLNPSNYSRESNNTPYIYVRFAGQCPACGDDVQATPKRHADATDPTAWVRCTCGQITRCEQSGSANHRGGVDQ